MQITNRIKNEHPGPLHVKWPAASIFRMQSPIAGADKDSDDDEDTNSYTVASAGIDEDAQLTYGRTGQAKNAPAYQDPQTADIAAVLTSELRLGTELGTYKLQVVSTYIPKEQLVVYSLVQNRRFDIVVDLHPQILGGFSESGWKTSQVDASTIKGAGLLLEEKDWPGTRVPNFKQFHLLNFPRARSAVSIPMVHRPVVMPYFVLISQDANLVGTGMVSLHSPGFEQ